MVSRPWAKQLGTCERERRTGRPTANIGPRSLSTMMYHRAVMELVPRQRFADGDVLHVLEFRAHQPQAHETIS